jgi:hypothetical protein
MSDDAAHEQFVAIGFASNGGAAYCPKCECTAVYTYAARRIWECQPCHHQFSVTSGTIFASHKLPIRDYLGPSLSSVNAVKGVSALQLGSDLDVRHKTAFVLAHKLSEAIGAEADVTLSGPVEVDGMYSGGHARRANVKADQAGRRLAEEQTGKRQVVVVTRERGGRTLPVAVGKQADAIPFIRSHALPSTTVHTDEAGGWDRLHADYEMPRVNHSISYSQDGACTNQAESFFSRLRRAEWGQHHHISGTYLHAYAGEMAWKEDNRRRPNGAQHEAVTGAALMHPVSRVSAGYWHRAQR